MDYNEILSNPLFARYYDLLAEWNQKFNLTAIIEKEAVYLKHFYDSVLPADMIADGNAVLDIGSGAGFPGIPLKLINPSLKVTLVDSVGKKVEFLNRVIADLGLTDIYAKHIRAEDFKERGFDVVTARAVAPLNILVEYSLPFLKIGGIMLAYKSQNLTDEIDGSKNALTILGGRIKKIVEKRLCADTVRSFVVVEKIKECPDIYPRRGNKPRLAPL